MGPEKVSKTGNWAFSSFVLEPVPEGQRKVKIKEKEFRKQKGRSGLGGRNETGLRGRGNVKVIA